jgi:hypothetical protein
MRILVGLLKLLAVGSVLGLTVYYAYEVGYRVAQGEVSALKEQVAQAAEDQRKAQEQAEGDRAALNEAKKQADDFKALYEQVKPTDALKDLTALLHGKLSEGMDPKRLAFVIKSAQNPHDCQTIPAKRFLVRTPRYKGPSTYTSVRLDEMVSLSADGAGANDGHEQYFDAERSLKLHVGVPGARDSDISGKLPIEHAVVVKNTEFHFTVSAASNRGFVEVTSEKCELR